MKTLLIITVILVNSLLGYFTAILDVYIHEKSNKSKWIMRPWSNFFLGKKITYNLSPQYITALLILGPLPKIFLNAIFLAMAIFAGIIISLAYIYGFILLYFGSLIQWIMPMPKNIIKEKRLTIRESINRLKNKLFTDEAAYLNFIVVLAIIISFFSILAFLH